MIIKLPAAAGVLVLVSFLSGQIQIKDPLRGEPSKKSARDKATLEAYLRHLFGPAVKVAVSDLTISPRLAGFYEANVHGVGTTFQSIRHVFSKLPVRTVELKGNSFGVALTLPAPANLESININDRGFAFNVPVFVSQDGQRIVIGEVIDLPSTDLSNQESSGRTSK